MINLVVCGLGNISHRVCQGAGFAKNMNLYGVMSRDVKKAEEFKRKYEAEKIFTSFEEVYADQNADVVYLCTPNYLHFLQIKDVLEHKKHVICEKPMVVSKEDLDILFSLAKTNHCFLMEAHKTACSPLLAQIKEMIEQGIIGDLYSIEAEYCHDIRPDDMPKDHWVFSKDAGCSRDIGVYPICFAHYFAQSDISNHFSVKSQYEDFECDYFFQSLVEYQNGVKAMVKSSWLHDIEHKGYGYLYGTEGYFKIPAYWKGKEAFLYKDGKSTKIFVDFASDFTPEIEEAARCIQEGKLESDRVPYSLSRDILEILE